MSVAGTYDTVVKSPMGEQKGTFTVVPGDDGNTFTGSMAGGHDRAQADDPQLHRQRERRPADRYGERRRLWRHAADRPAPGLSANR